jgi:hypothetical protein
MESFGGAMKRKSFIIFFVSGISLIFLSASTFSYYNQIIEADFFISGTKLESRDLDNLLLDKKSPAGEITNPSSFFLFLEDLFSNLDWGFFLPNALIQSIFSVLRC